MDLNQSCEASDLQTIGIGHLLCRTITASLHRGEVLVGKALSEHSFTGKGPPWRTFSI